MQVQSKLVEAKASRVSFQPVNERIHSLEAEVKTATARAKLERDLIAEIRKATEEIRGRGRKAGTPSRRERQRIATLREQLARETIDVEGPAGRLRNQVDALNRQLAELYPETRLAPLREELTGLEKQYDALRIARERVRPDTGGRTGQDRPAARA